MGILLRLDINLESNETSNLLNDFNSISNLEGVSKWVYKLNSEQLEVTNESIKDFMKILIELIENEKNRW